MEKKKFLFLGIFLFVILAITSLILSRHFAKSNEEKAINKIKKELISKEKSEVSSCIDISISKDNVVYLFDFSSKGEKVLDLRIVVISPFDKSLLLTYGFYQESDVLVKSKTSDNEIEKLTLLTSSAFSLDEFYIYLSYNGKVEYVKVVVGD